jgi:ribonuclease J
MLSLVKPRYFVPVHGEYRHLAIHAELGAAAGVPAENIQAIDSGTILEIDDQGLRVSRERASVEYVYVDGFNVDETGEAMLRDRHDMAHDGVVVVAVAVDRLSGRQLTELELITRGVAGDADTSRILDDAAEYIRQKVASQNGEARWNEIESMIADELSRFIAKRAHRHPLILPLVTRI